jgi:hypothetical protein
LIRSGIRDRRRIQRADHDRVGRAVGDPVVHNQLRDACARHVDPNVGLTSVSPTSRAALPVGYHNAASAETFRDTQKMLKSVGLASLVVGRGHSPLQNRNSRVTLIANDRLCSAGNRVVAVWRPSLCQRQP